MSSLPSLTWNVDPVMLRLGAQSIRYYSMFFSSQLLVGYLLLLGQLRRAGADDEEAGDLFAYLVPGILIGARLGHVLFYDWEHLLADPAWVWRIWTGGMSSHGAALGMLVAAHLFTKRRGIPLLEACDRLAPAVALAAVLQRLGNLMNSELVGKPTDGSWGVRFPQFDRGLGSVPLRHPTPLYEAALGLLVMLLLWLCDRAWGKEQRPRGALTGVLLLSLFVGRCCVEPFKALEPNEWGGVLNTAQLLSLPFIAAGLVVLWTSLRARRTAGWVVGG
jgi:phosphatidylglycerol:prolipoprotein diacylglycerol transferase